MLNAGPRGQFPRWRRSRKRLSVCSVLRCVFSKPCTKLMLHCNHRSGHLKTEHTESLFLLRRHLGNWPRIKHEKQTAGSAWETWTVSAADGVRCACVRWEVSFLLTFETAPFFCKHPVFFMARRFFFFVCVSRNIFRRCEACLKAGGQHCEILVWNKVRLNCRGKVELNSQGMHCYCVIKLQR